MKLKDVQEWIKTLPVEFLDFELVNVEEIKTLEDEKVLYQYDKPITRIGVMEEKKEIFIINESVEKLKNENSKK